MNDVTYNTVLDTNELQAELARVKAANAALSAEIDALRAQLKAPSFEQRLQKFLEEAATQKLQEIIQSESFDHEVRMRVNDVVQDALQDALEGTNVDAEDAVRAAIEEMLNCARIEFRGCRY